MHLMLLGAGVLVVAVGVLGLLFGAANYSPGVGNTLLLVGAVAVVGGALLVGLGAVLSRLRRIHDTLESQMVPRAIVPASGGAAPGSGAPFSPAILRAEPTTGVAPQLSAVEGGFPPPREAAEREPSANLRPRDRQPAPVAPARPATSAAPLPQADASQFADPPHADVDEPPVATSETIVVRADGTITTELTPRRGQPPPSPTAAVPSEGGSASLALPGSGSPAILKSGVVEGMAYTLYDDGSIEAEMPDGTIRFNSVAELRAHLRDRAQTAG